jgi:DNA-binding MarR family transcriptional regulator
MKANGDSSSHPPVSDLLHRAGQLADDAFVRHSTVQLTPRQFAVLSCVAEEDGLSQTDIVARTGVDRSTLADLILRLLGKGLLRRRRSKHDARRNEVHLTARGRAMLQPALTAARRTDEVILECLTHRRRQALLGGLAAIANARQDAEREES